MPFKLHSPYSPAGDQPEAIRQLTEGINRGDKYQTLLGVTGSGKTFTIANVIQQVQKPTLVLTHNKTLVAQLYGEFKQFFPENAVGFPCWWKRAYFPVTALLRWYTFQVQLPALYSRKAACLHWPFSM